MMHGQKNIKSLNTGLGAVYGPITLHILRTSVHRTLLQT